MVKIRALRVWAPRKLAIASWWLISLSPRPLHRGDRNLQPDHSHLKSKVDASSALRPGSRPTQPTRDRQA